MLRSVLTSLALFAAAALPALAGEVVISATDMSIPQGFTCPETKSSAAGRYGLSVVYEPSPAPHSVLKVTKAGKTLCTVEGSATSLHGGLATSKIRLFTRVDAQRKALEVVVILPSEMRDKIRNQVFYLPLIDAP